MRRLKNKEKFFVDPLHPNLLPVGEGIVLLNLTALGFDSFEGIPEPRVDKEMEVFKKGTYSCGEEEFLRNIANQ